VDTAREAEDAIRRNPFSAVAIALGLGSCWVSSPAPRCLSSVCRGRSPRVLQRSNCLKSFDFGVGRKRLGAADWFKRLHKRPSV
jgi:hypothetical protein